MNKPSSYDFRESLIPGEEFVFFDVEANGPEERVEGERSAISEMEIIQIGYAVFDYRFNILEKKSIIIKPEFFPKISTFIKSLTGISQERVDSGVLFPQGYKEFLNIAKHAKYVISWGSYDHLQLREELKRRNMLENPDFFNKLVNGNELVSEALGKRRKGMESCMNSLGLKFEGKHHDGMWDAVNGVRILEKVFQM